MCYFIHHFSPDLPADVWNWPEVSSGVSPRLRTNSQAQCSDLHPQESGLILASAFPAFRNFQAQELASCTVPSKTTCTYSIFCLKKACQIGTVVLGFVSSVRYCHFMTLKIILGTLISVPRTVFPPSNVLLLLVC